MPRSYSNYLTTGQAAKVLGMSLENVTKFYNEGHLQGFVMPGGTHRRIPVESLFGFMEKHNIPGDTVEVEALREALR